MWKKKNTKPVAFNSEKVFLAASQKIGNLYQYFQTSPEGLTEEEVEERSDTYGVNEVVHEKKRSPVMMFLRTFINPFIGILTVLAVISLVIDVILAPPEEREWTGVIIICVMVLLSAIMRFWQEMKAGEATDALVK